MFGYSDRLLVGFVAQIISVAFVISAATAGEVRNRNFWPLACGATLALIGTVPNVINGVPIGVEFAIVFVWVFALGAGLALVAQGVWRRVRGRWSDP